MPKRDNGIRLSSDDARLLPRYRDPELQAAVDARRQAEGLGKALMDDPDLVLSVKQQGHITKPLDGRRLRGIPAIGPLVSGEIANTGPEREVTRRLMNRWRLSERIGDAA